MVSVSRTARVGVVCVAASVCLLALSVWQGCAVTPENYATLSKWFDGVPDPNAPKGRARQREGDTRTRLSVFTHRPFEEEKCNECHDGSQVLSKNSSDICMKCHEKVPTAHARTHGPVAAVACLWCHHPHDSTKPYLMRDDARKVCVQCHEAGGLDGTREPAHADESRSCLECHSGHGGPKPYLLLRDDPNYKPEKAAPVSKQPASPSAAPKGDAPVSKPEGDRPVNAERGR